MMRFVKCLPIVLLVLFVSFPAHAQSELKILNIHRWVSNYLLFKRFGQHFDCLYELEAGQEVEWIYPNNYSDTCRVLSVDIRHGGVRCEEEIDGEHYQFTRSLYDPHIIGCRILKPAND